MQLKGNMILAMENITARMARLAKNELGFGRFLEIGEVVDHIDATGPDDLRRIAAEYLDPITQTLVTLGPSGDTGSCK
jgi:predicted Zn-dependent peptidase